MKSLNALDFPDVENNIYYQHGKEKFLALKHIVKSNPKNYHHQIVRSSCNKWLFDWINEQVPLLSDPFFNIGTKVCWILRGLTSFPECIECGFVFDDRNVSLRYGYPDSRSSKCSNFSDTTKQKQCKAKTGKYDKSYIQSFRKRAGSNVEKLVQSSIKFIDWLSDQSYNKQNNKQ